MIRGNWGTSIERAVFLLAPMSSHMHVHYNVNKDNMIKYSKLTAAVGPWFTWVRVWHPNVRAANDARDIYFIFDQFRSAIIKSKFVNNNPYKIYLNSWPEWDSWVEETILLVSWIGWVSWCQYNYDVNVVISISWYHLRPHLWLHGKYHSVFANMNHMI